MARQSDPEESDFVSEFGEDAFKEAVERVKYTRAGDVMQVVLAQRMHIPFQAPSINMYRALRSLNPSLRLLHEPGNFQIVSSSQKSLPEWKMVYLQSSTAALVARTYRGGRPCVRSRAGRPKKSQSI